MVLLKIAVKDNKLIKITDTLMIEDAINGVRCQFQFRCDWSTLKPTVVFGRGHIYPATKTPKTITASLDDNNECIVPPEVISDKGEFCIGMFGENDDMRIVTNWLYYRTQPGCYDACVPLTPPEPSVYDKILVALNDKSNIDHTHDQYATNDILNDSITAEAKERSDADEDLATRIVALESNFGDGEGTIESQIEAAVSVEASAREEAVKGVQDAVDTLDDKVGEIPEGTTATTVVGYVDEKVATINVDTEVLAGRVKTIEDDYLIEADKIELSDAIGAEKTRAEGIEAGIRTDIDAVMGDYLKTTDKTELQGKIAAEEARAKGVEEGLQTQINTIMNNPDTEGIINSINEFTQYITDHGEIAEGFRTDIDANKKAIEDHAALAAETYETKEDATAKYDELSGLIADKAGQPDWNQTDEKKADYIKNKPNVVTEEKFNEEISKRPIAYAFTKGEFNWEFSGNINDYENIIIQTDDDSTFFGIKILDVAPSAEERELISCNTYLGEYIAPVQTAGLWVPCEGDERIYGAYFDDNWLVPMIAAVYSTASIGEVTITPGIWVMQLRYNEQNALGIQTLHAPSVTIPGIKMDPNLIDAEWMATTALKDLEITISSENADDFEIICHDYTSMVKLSDVAPSKEQMIGATVIIDSVEEKITENVIEELIPGSAYIVGDLILVALDEVTDEGLTIPRGMYLGSLIPDILEMLGASSITLCVPNVLSTTTLLPEKFLSDKVVQAWKPITEAVSFDTGFSYPTKDVFYEFLKDKNYFGYDDGSYEYWVKISDVTPTEEEVRAGKISFDNQYDISIDTLNDIYNTKDYYPSLFNALIVGYHVIVAYEDFVYGNLKCTKGIWVNYSKHEDYSEDDETYVYEYRGVWSLSIPSITVDPGKKIDPELIDVEWMAKSSELNITINAGNIEKYDISEEVFGLFYERVLKLSDYTLTPEELAQTTISMTFDGEVESITGDLLEFMVGPNNSVVGDARLEAENLYMYYVGDIAFVLAGQNAKLTLYELDDTLMGTLLFPKGYFVMCNDDMIELVKSGAIINLFTPSVAESAQKLPEKYLPNSVVQAYKKEGDFPLDITWDGVIEDRDNTLGTLLTATMGFVKVSDNIPTIEELKQGTLYMYAKNDEGQSSFDTAVLPIRDCYIKQIDGGFVIYESDPNNSDPNTLKLPTMALVTDKTLFGDSFDDLGEPPSNGLYFAILKSTSMTIFANRLSLPSCHQTITKKIDPELIDTDWYAGQMAQGGELEVEFDGDITAYPSFEIITNTYMVKLSDVVLTIDEIQSGTVSFVHPIAQFDRVPVPEMMEALDLSVIETTLYGANVRVLIDSSGESMLLGSLIEDSVINGMNIPKGTYVVYANLGNGMSVYVSYLYIPYAADQQVLAKIPEKYLPDINIPDMSQYATKEDIETATDNIVDNTELTAMLQEVLK